MLYPKFIEKNNTIGVPAPSDGANSPMKINKYYNAKAKLEKLGYKIELSKYMFNSENARSASAKERATELNRMFESKNIDYISCAAGGEFLVEILPYVKFENLIKNPKFIEGFSDPTGLLFPITTKYDIATIYGVNFSNYGVQDYSRDMLEHLELIKGNLVEQQNYEMYEDERPDILTGLEGYNFTDKVEWKILNGDSVNVKGRIIGGCLDIISEIAGTKYDGTAQFNTKYKYNGIIWYFDNCELSMEELIRTMWKLNELDYFKNTKAIIFGRNGINISCLGYTMAEALRDSVIGKLNIPIIYDADISHKGPCLTIINGSVATIKCENGKGSIKFELK